MSVTAFENRQEIDRDRLPTSQELFPDDIKEQVLLEKILKFYSCRENFQSMYEVVTEKRRNAPGKISLRCLSWVVSNGLPHHLAELYDAEVQANRAKHCDAYKRKTKVTLRAFGQELETTIPQLNFFRIVQTHKVTLVTNARTVVSRPSANPAFVRAA
jgi:hypothetical protein